MKQDNSALNNRMKQLDDPWFTPGETHLDTSGLNPIYRPVTIEQNDFDVPLAGSEKYRDNWARDAVLNPEILSTLAETQNLTEDEQAVLKHYGNKNPSFKFGVPGYEVFARWNRGAWECVGINEDEEKTAFKLGDVDKFDRDGVMIRAQKYLVPKKPWRELNKSELLTVARMAPGSPESAIYSYINYALPDIDQDISSNPAYQELCDEIIWFVAENHYPEFDETARAFMVDRLGRRPLTWNMAKELWAMFKESQLENKRRPSLLFNPPEPEPETPESVQESLDNLSDDALNRLRTETIKLASRR